MDVSHTGSTEPEGGVRRYSELSEAEQALAKPFSRGYDVTPQPPEVTSRMAECEEQMREPEKRISGAAQHFRLPPDPSGVEVYS